MHANVQPHIAARQRMLTEAGERISQWSWRTFFVGLVCGTLFNIPFAVGEYYALEDQNIGAFVALVSSSFALNMATALIMAVWVSPAALGAEDLHSCAPLVPVVKGFARASLLDVRAYLVFP